MIKESFERITEEIKETCARCGRNFEGVQLIVVTKAQPAEKIRQVIEAGANKLGENYAEETVEKIEALGSISKSVEWHMIGHVQSRKSKIVATDFDFLHSLDSIKLARRINAELKERDKLLPVLLQYNVGGEDQKYGWDAKNQDRWPALLESFDEIVQMSNLVLSGLMTMPPYEEIAQDARKYFIRLRNLRDYLNKHFPEQDLGHLSMGTSHDFQVAIEEGATFIRIGTAIMGER